MLNSDKQEAAAVKRVLHKPVWFTSCGSQMFAHHLFEIQVSSQNNSDWLTKTKKNKKNKMDGNLIHTELG